jgi:adenine/guanine phosphoribosyltransferase-like PRPP-binding protein
MHYDLIDNDDSVLIIDDLIAIGVTVEATIKKALFL